ncbi:MAG: efflux RND transporter periplasmic adaptor subunit [Alphaproteobacteria bacterium]|nr:efflux RND transporter periplasmic adaptor subunit [Alphaproteobacteria bacterium]
MRVFLSLFVFLAFSSPVLADDAVYFCPMHPHITGQKGDQCPICGMTLVPKEEMRPQSVGTEDSFQITPDYVAALGVKTTRVSSVVFGKDIRAFGRVEADTAREYHFDLKAEGWIVDLRVSGRGEVVKKGDLLFTLYSPELRSAQSDFLVAIQTGSRLGSVESRLRLFGMDDKSIEDLRLVKHPPESTNFYAPQDGVVSDLKVRAGSYLGKGESVLVLQDLSQIWVMAQVAVKDISQIKIGQAAKIILPETGMSLPAVVELVEPLAEGVTQTVSVRLVVENKQGVLKPSQYVDARISGEQISRLSVPDEAVLYGSQGAYVIETVGDGYFRPVMVEVGITAMGETEILTGLTVGQQIVRSGQFMIDAESNLRGGMKNMERHHHE